MLYQTQTIVVINSFDEFNLLIMKNSLNSSDSDVKSTQTQALHIAGGNCVCANAHTFTAHDESEDLVHG